METKTTWYDINTASAEKKSIDWNIIQDTTDKIR